MNYMSEHKQGGKSRALLRTCWGFSVVLTLAPTSGRSCHSLIPRDWIQNCCRRGCQKHSAVAERSVAEHRRAMTGEIYHMWVDLPGEINSPAVVMSGKVWRIAALFLYLVWVLFCWGGGLEGGGMNLHSGVFFPKDTVWRGIDKSVKTVYCH